MSTTKPILYIANPDVSCREEGPEGGLLFNPDTDQVLVINGTGLLIWRALEEPRTPEQIVTTLVEQCEDVPTGEVEQDVREFVNTLQEKGFIGVYEQVHP